MKVLYTIEMEDAVVHGECFDQLVVSWEEEATSADVERYSEIWLTTTDLLISNMNGLDEVGESILKTEPIEDHCSPRFSFADA